MNSFETVAEAFGLPYDPKDQDWDLQVADSRRISEFMDGYPLLPDNDCRRTLVAVLLASFEEAHLEGRVEKNEWLRFWNLIQNDIEASAFELAYWCGIQTIGGMVEERLKSLGYAAEKENYSLHRLP